MEQVRLRRATAVDADLLFAWRNDPLTRARSLQPNPVEWETHLRWLADCLDNHDRQLFIAELTTDREPELMLLGTVRSDRSEQGFELSWTVAPEQRGKGWGKRLVAALIDSLPDGACYRAVVLNDNPASQRIAVGLAMKPEVQSADRITYSGRKLS